MAKGARVLIPNGSGDLRAANLHLEQTFNDFVSAAVEVLMLAREATKKAETEQRSSVTPLSQELLTVNDVMDMLKVGKNTVYELKNSGKLPAKKIGKCLRFRPSDVERYAQETA